MTGERAIIGIDPGLNGALARYWPHNGNLQIADMPTIKVPRGNRDKSLVDEVALARLLDDWSPSATEAWLERVNAMPSIPGADGERRSMGTQSSFDFGRSYGLIRGVLAANFLIIHDVTPQSWKKTMRVASDKNQARQRASALCPRHGHLWPLKKHDGRAEAAMIALYGAGRAETARAA